MSLSNALLRASHAESLKGGTADLLAILERDSKESGQDDLDDENPQKRPRLPSVPDPPLTRPSEYLRSRCPLCFGGNPGCEEG